MKKMFLISAVVICATVFSAYNVSRSLAYSQKQKSEIADLCLKEIESLTQDESGGGNINDGCQGDAELKSVDLFDDGAYREVYTVGCELGVGKCYSGNYVNYYTSKGELIGTDNRLNLYYCA